MMRRGGGGLLVRVVIYTFDLWGGGLIYFFGLFCFLYGLRLASRKWVYIWMVIFYLLYVMSFVVSWFLGYLSTDGTGYGFLFVLFLCFWVYCFGLRNL